MSVSHISPEVHELKSPPRALESILWIVFFIVLLTSPAVVIAVWRLALS